MADEKLQGYDPSRQEKDTPQLNITEVQDVTSYAQSLQLTKGQQIPAELRKRLELLLKLSHQEKQKVFVVSAAANTWTVVAPNQEGVANNADRIISIMNFQAAIDPENLYRMCIHSHGYAAVVGVSDGNMDATGHSKGESIYPIRGIHEIGYVDSRSTNATIYFDLTSKPYVFTSGYKPQEAVCDGLIVIDSLGSNKTIQRLYSSGWKREPYDHTEQTRRSYTDAFNTHVRRSSK